MATLHIHDVSDKVAKTYFNAPLAQQQRLKSLVEATILFWTETSHFQTTLTQKPAIRHTAGVCGGNACIRNTRIPVWTLVSVRSQGATDYELLEDYPSLVQTDLDAAWIYYQHHEIVQSICRTR